MIRSLAIPIFRSRVYLCDSFEDAKKLAEKRNYDLNGFDLELDEDWGCTFTLEDGVIILLVVGEHNVEGLVAHEAYHTANRVMDYCDIKQRDEELVAFIMQWIVDKWFQLMYQK